MIDWSLIFASHLFKSMMELLALKLAYVKPIINKVL